MFDNRNLALIGLVCVLACMVAVSQHASADDASVFAIGDIARAGELDASNTPDAETWFLVSPGVLSISAPAGVTVDAELSISNRGSNPVDLQFGILAVNSNGSQINAPRGEPKVLWSQGQSGNRGVAAGYSLFSDSGSYVGDDFFLPAPATVSRISAMGFNNVGTLTDQVLEIEWYIFPDSGGVPAGDPEQNPEAAVFSFTAESGDLGVDLADDNIVLDLELAVGDSLPLAAGSYWLVLVPVFDFEIESGKRRWNWFEGRPAQAFSAQILSPELFGIPDWIDIPTRIPQVPEFAGLAFSVEGLLSDPGSQACEEDLPAWLSITTESTTVPGGETRLVEVNADTSMLPVGSTEIVFCIANKLESLVPVFVPLRLEIVLDPIFSDSFELQR